MKFDNTITMGNVLTFIGLLGTVFGFYGVMDKRVAVIEEWRTNQVQVDRRQDQDSADMKRTNREDFKEINSKLDRLLVVAQSGR